MSLEKETESSPNKAAESPCRPKMQSKISYSRDFLLSLSGLDICKKLPSGFDESFLSELEAASSHGAHDRSRNPGSFPVPGFRRTEFSSSPPARGELGTYSRGVYGRWDNRTSSRGERDNDTQSERDSESGRRPVTQSRRSWQNTEHDGLLGSGSFPRQSGYAAKGSSAPKVQSNEHSLLNKSTEPYQPPRPYKAVPHSRRETRDALNDETFGSAENTNQDRAEDERRRRLSFELIRKEQQKSLQEKQKPNLAKHKHDPISEVNESLEDAKQGTKVFDRSDDVDVPVTKFASKDDNTRSLTNPARKPLVPPGFRSSISERNPVSKSSVNSHSEEVGRSEADGSLHLTKALVENGILDNKERHAFQEKDIVDQQYGTSKKPSLSKGDQAVAALSTELNVSIKKVDIDNQSTRTSSISEIPETRDSSRILNLDSNKVPGLEVFSGLEQDNTNSILHKLFGGASAVNINGSSGLKEHHEPVIDDAWSQNDVKSSKFAHWFLEDEKKPSEKSSYSTHNDLLSLIVGSDKGGSKASSHVKAKHGVVLPDLPLQNSENIKLESSRHFNPEADPAILTCEDLEQKILSEYGQNNVTSQAPPPPPVLGFFLSGADTKEQKPRADDRASQHLLSLLLKENDSKEVDSISFDKSHVSEGGSFAPGLDNFKAEKVENVPHSGKSLTLETLFGSAFMKELQSAEAPVSIQRSASGSARIDFPEQQGDSKPGTGSSESHKSNVLLSSGQDQDAKMHRIESWFNGAQVEAGPLRNPPGPARLKGVDIQFPEEDNFIPGNNHNPNASSRFMTSNGEHQSFDIVEKLAALNNSGFRDGHSLRGPYDVLEPDVVPNRPSPQFHPPQAHGRPFLPPLDPRPGPFNSFTAPEGYIHHNAAANQQFPANLQRPTPFNNANARQMGFEVPHRHHPILQQMQTPGNLPPPHLLRDFPRGGGPLPPQSRNQESGFLQDGSMKNFPHHQQQQPNFGGRGPSPANAGRNHPEALQRLIEMELRANNSKQSSNPYAAAAGHNNHQGMFGNEQGGGMGFRYR